MSDYISRGDAKAYIRAQRKRFFKGLTVEEAMLMLLDEVPAAEVMPVVQASKRTVNRPIHARWIWVTTETGERVYGKEHDHIDHNPVEFCNECGKRLDDTFQNYCPNCGAKMDGADKP